MNNEYTKTAKILHWVMALLIFYALLSAIFKGYLPKGDIKTTVMDYHKIAGISVLWLVFIRFGWRILNPPPKPIGDNLLLNKFAHIIHIILYLLMLALPITGILFLNAKGYSVDYLGIELPNILSKDIAIGKDIKELHESLGWFLLFIVGIHVAGALKHHYIDKDDTLNRIK